MFFFEKKLSKCLYGNLPYIIFVLSITKKTHNMNSQIFTTDAETINNHFSVFEIDLDTMFDSGECSPEDEVVVNIEEDYVSVRFAQGGHLIDPGKDADLVKKIMAIADQL